MRKLLLKKLYASLDLGIAFIVTAMMFSVTANAQIVYSDVNPDSSFACNGNQNCNQSFFLDLNNDGLVDYRINLGYYYHNSNVRWVSIIDSVGNAFAISANGAKKFFMNDTIGPDQAWQGSSMAYLRRWSSAVNGSYRGEWIYETDKYLGLALNVSGLTYYGWVRLDVTVDPSTSTCICIIKDYAYNIIPNQPILAGETGTSTTGRIENSFASSINLFPNPASNQLTIDNAKSKIENVTIYELSGRAVYSENHHNPNANSEITIDVSKIPAGVYVVKIQSAGIIGTKKLVVEK